VVVVGLRLQTVRKIAFENARNRTMNNHGIGNGDILYVVWNCC